VKREIEDVFLGMGFEVYEGDEVTDAWHNFDALTTDPGHPSRSPTDTFYLSDDVLLRTHTSPDQIRLMESRQPPIYAIMPGRCYRRDTPDATHSPTFLQVESLVVDRGITLSDLKGVVLEFFRALFGPEREVRMRTSYFPFTEPSVEFDVTCFLCNGQGCSVCKHSGWIEMGGAGWVDPAVFSIVGYDPEVWSGFAFGLGIERIAMLRHGLGDLRLFWENDVRMLEQF
jgi:phenylalanyl-tRNA synthetase alpha chain